MEKADEAASSVKEVDKNIIPISSSSSQTSIPSDDDGRGLFQYSDGSGDNLSSKTFLHKVWHYTKVIRMEPGFLIYMTASVMGNIIASDLQIDRACRINIGYNDTVCDGVMSRYL